MLPQNSLSLRTEKCIKIFFLEINLLDFYRRSVAFLTLEKKNALLTRNGVLYLAYLFPLFNFKGSSSSADNPFEIIFNNLLLLDIKYCNDARNRL